MARIAYIALAPLAAFILVISRPAYAERQSVEFAPFACVSEQSPVAILEDATYLNLRLINISNSPKKPWFVRGESTISVFIQFLPLGDRSTVKWNYARVIDKVGDTLMGLDQNIPLGPRRMPLPRQIGGIYPTLSVRMIETERTNAFKPYLEGLNRAVMSIPNPASATASAALATISELYEKLFDYWVESNGQHIELGSVGFEFSQKVPTDCSRLGAGNPLLGNVVYVVMGSMEYKGNKINKAWARSNLVLDNDGSGLVYKHDVVFPSFMGDKVKKKGEPFDLVSYMLIKFETKDSEFTPDAIFNNQELKQQFREARMADANLRNMKREVISDNVRTSTLLSFPDLKLLLTAFDKYVEGSDPWDRFWVAWAGSTGKAEILSTYGKDPRDKRIMPQEAFNRAVERVFENGQYQAELKQTFAKLAADDAESIEHYDKGHSEVAKHPTLKERITKDALKGTVASISGEYYVIKDNDGKQHKVHVDKSTKLDKVVEGDMVKAYVTDKGHVTTLQRD